MALAELLSAELRLMLLQGRDDEAAALLGLVRHAPFSQAMRAKATRPLVHGFQVELDELDGLLVEEEDANFEGLSQHLQRLETLFDRWKRLDPDDSLDLRELSDQATRRALRRFEKLDEYKWTWSRKYEVVTRIGNMARGDSLRRRVDATMVKLSEARREAVCYYCQEHGAEFNYSVIAKLRKLTKVEHGFNSVTRHYSIKTAQVLRRSHCTNIHEALQSSKPFGILICINAIIGIGVVFSGTVEVMLAVTAGVVLTVIPGFATGALLSGAITGANHRAAKDVNGAPTVRDLIAEGYDESHRIFVSKTALEDAKRSQ